MADTDQVLNLAAIIREVDGNNRKGAAALAESILDHPRFRAALADGPAVPDGREPASVVGEPSDEELNRLWFETDGRAVLGAKEYARAVLARWGTSNLAETRSSLGGMPTPVPADKGEVEELMEGLRLISDGMSAIGHDSDSWFVARAADLLQRGQSALHRLHRLQQENARFREPERTILCDILANGTLLPDPDGKRYGVQPVPVSERLPGPEDCLDEGWAWFFSPRVGWRQAAFPVSTAYTHWLPAHALPLPGQEVEG